MKAVGFGALAGILALIFFNLGIAGPGPGRTVDAIDPGPVEATDAVGAGIIERARVAIVPQVLPSYISYCLYVFELNIRASVIIGLVGAGGIGFTLQTRLNFFDYTGVGLIILVIFVVVLIIDSISVWARSKLI